MGSQGNSNIDIKVCHNSANVYNFVTIITEFLKTKPAGVMVKLFQ